MTHFLNGDQVAARIFMSYHKRNATLAKALVESLRADIASTWPDGPRAEVWFDEALRAGDVWDPVIQTELELADIILFLVTPASLEAGYMWNDEFPIALDRFRAGEGRVRLVPLLYSEDQAPILTHRFTRGLSRIPSKPHDQLGAEQWTKEVVAGVRLLIEGVLLQRNPPMTRLTPALALANDALQAAEAMFVAGTSNGFYGPVLASEINNILGALRAALGFGGAERLRALSVWEPKLKTCFVRMRDALPDHSLALRVLRDAIDEVTTFSSEETLASPAAHKSEFMQPGGHDAVQRMREEVGAARQVFEDIGTGPEVENPIEREARAYTADAGSRHATLAEALLDEPRIDSAALSAEISGAENVAQSFANTVDHLGDQASGASKAEAARLTKSVRRTVEVTQRFVEEGRAPTSRTNAADAPGEEIANEVPLRKQTQPQDRYLIPLDLLNLSPARSGSPDQAILESRAKHLEKVLSDFNVEGDVEAVRAGPVVNTYEFALATHVKASKVVALTEDIARTMSATSARVAAIAGRNTVAIELPASRRETLRLRDVLSSAEFASVRGELPLALGETTDGAPFGADLDKMRHLLIGGTTGSGKSGGINAMILSLLYTHTPEQCRFIMIDPKMLELGIYEGIPHLLHPVISDPKRAVVALKWVVREMEERYARMSKLSVRSIKGYNERVAEALARGERLERTEHSGFDPVTGDPTYETRELVAAPMPYLIVVIDESADLMITGGQDMEAAIQRLAQMARAAGIHVIMATQRPSIDVITSTMKTNFPSRISYQVSSLMDSRTLIGERGAEQLLGNGDLLLMEGGGRIRRLHGPLVTDAEVERVVEWLKASGGPSYDPAVTRPYEDDEEPLLENDEVLYQRAVQIVSRDRRASTSYLQRRLQLGYNKAATLIERMEKDGVISVANHAGKREVIIDQLDEDDEEPIQGTSRSSFGDVWNRFSGRKRHE